MPPNIAQLYCRAASFDELLSERFESALGQKADADHAASRLAAWCKSAASGDWDTFAKRLAVEGWDFERVLARFATARPSPDQPAPQWLTDAAWILAALAALPPAELPSARAGKAALPFEDILAPIVHQARGYRDAWLGSDPASSLEPAALADLDYQLADQLADLAMIALYEEFDQFRAAAEEAGAGPPDEEPTGEPRRVLYHQFTAALRHDPAGSLAGRYPVLVRLLATAARQWINTTAEFIARLSCDQDALAAAFLGRAQSARVAAIGGGVSDLHNEGRSVLILTFGTGRKLLYKPKDLRSDHHWYALIERLNAAAPPIDLRAARVLVRDGYGWSEHIDPDPCASRAEVDAFYRRSGAYLALFHLFCATDMHEENMIASGSYPVPIDLEMILQPELSETADAPFASPASLEANRKVARSVSSIGLLPGVVRGPNTRLHGMGGMAHRSGAETRVYLDHVNTDDMAPVYGEVPGSGLFNVPQLDGRPVPFAGQAANVTDGFERYAGFLAGAAKPILTSALARDFADIPIRVVLRTTRFYGMLLSRLKDHRFWSDGVLWSVHADFIARFADYGPAGDQIWPLYRAERRALLDLNIPHFTCQTGSTAIAAHSGEVAVLSGETAIATATAKIVGFDADDIRWQAQIAELGLTGDAAAPVNYFVQGIKRELPEPPAPYTPAELIARSTAIRDQLAALAIRAEDTVAWIGLCNVPDTEAYQLVPLGHDLHSGVSGIGLFLAAHARVSGEGRSAAFARQAFACLRTLLRGPDAPRFARAIGLGGALGLGSHIYALASASALLADDSLLRDARVAAGLITPDILAADTSCDVTGGAAGAILGLLKLYRMTRDPSVLQAAQTCGAHLLAQRTFLPDGLAVWPYMNGRPFTGFSHGASGYAYALGALAQATGETRFDAAARDALAYEARLYAPQHTNWPDFRDEGSAEGSFHSCQWCHGAGGIGLARLGLARLDPERMPELAGDIEAALARVLSGWPVQADSLCCGNLGNIHFLMDAARVMARPDLLRAAQLHLRSVVDDAAKHGTYCWPKGGDRYNLGLFNGLAGVGYSLLRQADPALPNPLLWE